MVETLSRHSQAPSAAPSQRSQAPSHAPSKASKATSRAAAAESSDDEPTAAQERERFIAMTRGNYTQDDENDDHGKFMRKTQKRMNKSITNQNAAMPKVCQGMPYVGPTVITHPVEKNGNNCVITNDTHSKMTNNGFSRGAEGRFYMH